MDMTGAYTIAASRQMVWDALNDAGMLKQSIPGCDMIEQTSEGGFAAKVTAKVGPVKARFSGTVSLSDLDPPNSYTIAGEGTGGAAGFARGSASVRLEDVGDGRTTLNYTVNAQVGGKLAQIGSRLIDSAAKKLAGEFFGNFAQIVEAQAISSSDHGPNHDEGEPEMSDPPHVEENVYPNTHWAVWATGAIAVIALVSFLVNL